MDAHTFAIITAVFIFLFVIELIRRQKMTFKFSFAWLLGSAVIFLFAFQHQLFVRISELAGFELPSNFLFFLVLIFFIFLSLFLTIYIDKQTSRTEILAQEIAILEYKVRQLAKNKEPRS